jgi:hypothetical protein
MEIAHLSLRSLIWELRYRPAFALWDRAGAIWAQAVERWPALTMRQVAPNQTSFVMDNRIELGVHLDRSFVSAAGSKLSLEELLPYCAYLTDNVLPTLHVDTILRVGFKATFLKEYQTMDAAVSDFLSTGIIKNITGKHFGIEGSIRVPAVNLRLEDEYRGCQIAFLIRERTLKIDMPFIGEEDITPSSRDHLELVFECDYYTKGTMSVGQMRARHWVEEALQVIRRDSGVILREA